MGWAGAPDGAGVRAFWSASRLSRDTESDGLAVPLAAIVAARVAAWALTFPMLAAWRMAAIAKPPEPKVVAVKEAAPPAWRLRQGAATMDIAPPPGGRVVHDSMRDPGGGRFGPP